MSQSTSKRALITGASTGIGRALSLELGRRGWSLGLLARRGELLEQLVNELTAAGSRAVAVSCDVLDAAAVRAAVRSCEEGLGGPIDMAIANAGVSVPTHATKFVLADAEQIIRVNVLGMIYLFDAVIPSMVERRSGRFVGVASIAGLRGLPTSSAYSASKAAMQAFLESSRVELAPYDISVVTVNPGFVDTPMTEKNRFKMPFLMNAQEAAVTIADGLEKGRRVIEFPLPMSLLMRFARLLPSAIYDAVTVPYGRRKIDLAKVKR